jgi:murein hydrolase activator
MTFTKKIVFPILFVLFYSSFAFSQVRTDLENRRKANQKEIELTNLLLKETEKSKKLSLEKVFLLERKIDKYEDNISLLNEEVKIIGSELNETYQIIDNLKKDIETLKKEYASIIVLIYKQKKLFNERILIFSAVNFNQAYKRIKFLKFLNDYKEKQISTILDLELKLLSKYKEYSVKQQNKTEVLNIQKSQKSLLIDERRKKEENVNELKRKEQKLKDDLKDKIRIEGELRVEIRKIIEIERKKARAKNETKIYKSLNTEDKAISDKFMVNRGHLNWPVDNGVVIGKFGEQNHPVLKDIKIRNNGVDLSANPNSAVRSLFSGEVSKIFAIPGANYAVIIRHGNYLSVYQGLSDVRVKMGDMVKENQNIGHLFYNDEKNVSILHLEIWDELKSLDPESWLRKIK